MLTIENGEEYVWNSYRKREAMKDETGFDAVLYADSSGSKVADRLGSILGCAKRLRESGWITVVPEAYQGLPYKSAAIEIVLNLAGCTIQVPYGYPKSVSAWKNRLTDPTAGVAGTCPDILAVHRWGLHAEAGFAVGSTPERGFRCSS